MDPQDASALPAEDLKRWIQEDWIFLDVRSQGEHQSGNFPSAQVVPILNDDERALVGTCYKKEGREKAILLGESLVSGATRTARIQKWITYLEPNPRSILFCYRGGLRSKYAQTWCREAGIDRPRVREGYKGLRYQLMKIVSDFSCNGNLLLVGGTTGSGKTDFIQKIEREHFSHLSLDLEQMAEHKGSAFGGLWGDQPSQATFENRLAWQIALNNSKLMGPFQIMEDESRLIGRVVQPENFFQRMRASPLLFLEVPLEKRAERICFDYVTWPTEKASDEQFSLWFGRLRQAVQKISKRLGGLRTSEVLALLNQAEAHRTSANFFAMNSHWIQKLLEWYYDPLYLDSLRRRNPKIVYRGDVSGAEQFLQEQVKNVSIEFPAPHSGHGAWSSGEVQ